MSDVPDLIDVGPRTAGAKRGMVVRERATSNLGTIVEVAEPWMRFALHCLRVGDVAVEMAPGCYRVSGPQRHFWTQFELVVETL